MRRRRFAPVKHGEIILDYDSNTTTVYGKQEGSDRGRCFRKKDKPGYQPRFAFIGGLGVMVNHRLCPQSRRPCAPNVRPYALIALSKRQARHPGHLEIAQIIKEPLRPDNRIKNAYLQTAHLSSEHRQAILKPQYAPS